MAPPDPRTLENLARDLRRQAGAVDDAHRAYHRAHERLVWDGPGRTHLDAYHRPSRARLDAMHRSLESAAEQLKRAARDLADRLDQLRVDEENVHRELPGYFERLGYDPVQIAQYRRQLPPSGDPRWADYARTVVGRSATGARR
jgi:hypothetical protein